jgi:hypothetical protein
MTQTQQTTTQTFKSERSAKMAVTKAAKVYETARDARLSAQHARGTWDPTAEETEVLDNLEAAYKALPKGERYESEAFKSHCNLQSVIMNRPLNIAQAAEDVAFCAMKSLYDAAKAQGFYTPCRHLEYSATRELIAMNMD